MLGRRGSGSESVHEARARITGSGTATTDRRLRNVQSAGFPGQIIGVHVIHPVSKRSLQSARSVVLYSPLEILPSMPVPIPPNIRTSGPTPAYTSHQPAPKTKQIISDKWASKALPSLAG